MEILLYRATGSNSSERVEWVLNFKGVSYNSIEVSSEELSTTYLAINPFGYVPALSVDGLIFSESMAIAEYLEAQFSDRPLLGNNLNERTHIRSICEYVNATIHSPQNRTVLKFFYPELDDVNKRKLRGQWIMTCLEKLVATICPDSGYAIGTDFSLADIFIASIYKKALQHGCIEHDFYNNYLAFIRNNKSVSVSEPRI